ncbi:MAG: hypothetical protein K8T26_01475 [Lentisphaerae bacterium]|nr:hypothetical protein [Lentisphaerota bacterium]
MKTTAVSITATQWNPAAPLDSFKRFAISIHEQAKAVLLQDGHHTEMFFFMPLNGQGHLVQWSGKDREQEATWLRRHIHEHYIYGLIHVVEAWVHMAKQPGDHTVKQLMAGEMTVSQLRPADRMECLMCSAQSRDGWANCWVDSFTKDQAGKIVLGGCSEITDFRGRFGRVFG